MYYCTVLYAWYVIHATHIILTIYIYIYSLYRYFTGGDDHLPVLRDVREGQHRPQRLRAVKGVVERVGCEMRGAMSGKRGARYEVEGDGGEREDGWWCEGWAT